MSLFFETLIQLIEADDGLSSKEKKPLLARLKKGFERAEKQGKLEAFLTKLQSDEDLEAYVAAASEVVSGFEASGDARPASLRAAGEASTEVTAASLRSAAEASSEGLAASSAAASSAGEASGEAVAASLRAAGEEAAAAAPEEEENDGLRPVIPVSKDVADDGNCFYSSLYHASRQNPAMLQRVAECFGADASRESAFIRSMREAVQLKIEEGALPMSEEGDIYDALAFAVGQGNYEAVLEAYPAWFQEEFEELPDRDTFLEQLAAGAGTDRNWVSEIEVSIVKNALEECGIQLVVYNEEVARADPNAINLLNQGEAHFIYFSFNTPAKYTESLRYLERLYEECQRKCRGIKVRIDSLREAAPKRATTRSRRVRGGRRSTRRGQRGGKRI